MLENLIRSSDKVTVHPVVFVNKSGLRGERFPEDVCVALRSVPVKVNMAQFRVMGLCDPEDGLQTKGLSQDMCDIVIVTQPVFNTFQNVDSRKKRESVFC